MKCLLKGIDVLLHFVIQCATAAALIEIGLAAMKYVQDDGRVTVRFEDAYLRSNVGGPLPNRIGYHL